MDEIELKLFLFIGLFFLSNAALPDIGKCNLELQKGGWRQGTESRLESEYFLTNELREKLSRFEECIEQETTVAAVEANQANGQSSGSDAGVGGSATSVTEEELALDAGPSDKGTDDRKREPVKTTRTEVTKRVASRDSSMLDEARRALRIREDSIARLLREAMEKETDPAKREALRVEYNKHVGRLVE